MTHRTILIFLTVLGVGCKDSPPQTTGNSAEQTTQQKPSPTLTVAATPQESPPEQVQWTKALKAREPELIQQVLTRHDLVAGSIDITVTDTLLIKVSGKDRTCERQVPRGWVEAELITNFDHTLDHCVREIVEPMR